MNKNQRQTLIIAILCIMISIVLGAFAAHGLKDKISPEKISSFETGAKYLMYHGLGLLILGVFEGTNNINLKLFKQLIIIGLVFFSGSIFLLNTQEIMGLHLKFLGPITPIGGLILIISWIILLIRIIQQKTNP